MVLSIHYQNEDPENDEIKQLATGKYDRFSGLVLNGQEGVQNQIWFDVDQAISFDYWGLDQVTLELIGWGINGVLGNICFTTVNEDFILVKNPDTVKTALRQELCPNSSTDSECNQATSKENFSKNKTLFTMTKNGASFEFMASHFVSFKSNGEAQYWVGDLQTLIDQKVCHTDATLAVGKRYLRYVELSLKKD